MDNQTADLAVYPALALSTSIYALLLDDNKQRARQKLEPDWTWLEVATGTAMCLIAAAIRSRLGPDDRRTYERSVWLAFVVGGFPIIIWQLARAIDRQRRRADTLQHYDTRSEDGERKGPPARLAYLRWPSPPANGANG